MMTDIQFHSFISVDACSASDAKQMKTGSRDDAIVRNRFPANVVDSFFSEVSRVIMVPSNKDNPVVRFTQPSGNVIVNLFIIPGFVKAETAISGYNENGVRTSISDAQLENKRPKVSVDISGDDNLLSVRIIEQFHFAVQKKVLTFVAR